MGCHLKSASDLGSSITEKITNNLFTVLRAPLQTEQPLSGISLRQMKALFQATELNGTVCIL
jgi:hypothetical protein